MDDKNVRIVVIHFEDFSRAELQVRLCEEHWTAVKTIIKNKVKMKVVKEAYYELLKQRFRATRDSAIRLDEVIREFDATGWDWDGSKKL